MIDSDDRSTPSRKRTNHTLAFSFWNRCDAAHHYSSPNPAIPISMATNPEKHQAGYPTRQNRTVKITPEPPPLAIPRFGLRIPLLRPQPSTSPAVGAGFRPAATVAVSASATAHRSSSARSTAAHAAKRSATVLSGKTAGTNLNCRPPGGSLQPLPLP